MRLRRASLRSPCGRLKSMDPWTVGLVAIVVVGLAVIVFGALSDRRRNQRAAREMLAAPQRTIPQFRPDAATPHYLSELQARRAPAEPAAVLTAAERRTLAEEIAAPTTTTVEVGYASRDFVTDRASGWAVLTGPRVLLCAQRVDSVRELLPVLEKIIMSRTPLVLVAPELAPEVLATLEVNQIRGLMSLLAVVATDPADLSAIEEATGAARLNRSDLQSGYVLPTHLGRTGVWVSDQSSSHLIADEHHTPAPSEAASDQPTGSA